MYATTTVRAFDALSAVEAVQRLASPSVQISHIGWDEQNHVLVAILQGEHYLLTQLRETLTRMDIAMEETEVLSLAVNKAKKIADVVEFEDVRKEDSFTY